MIAAGGVSRSGLAGEPSFTLGALEVRPATREVMTGGTADVLEPRVMQVLVTLANRRGQVVSRSDLIDACWDGRAVGDDAINRCVQALRRLGQTRGGFAIQTIARVGYRLDELDVQIGGAAREAVRTATLAAHERRHVTVLVCTLAREKTLDPEDWYAVAHEWRGAASDAASRFGAYVEAGRSDRLIAYFGYPAAQEDAALRAVRAGLAVLAARPELSVRTGVHAGLVVVASDGADIEMFGEASEIALQAQEAAPPGGMAMTGAVHDLVSDVVGAAPLDRMTHDESSAPVRLYRVISADHALGRGFAPREATPFVGREDEARLLADRWARVLEGEGRFALVTGEPGIGKTRLIQEFKAGLRGDEQRVIECGGAMLSATTPFHAVVQILRQGLGWSEGDNPAERLTGLERALALTGLDLAETVPLIGELLDLPIPATYSALSLTADQRRQRLLAALAAWVFAAAREKPLVLVAEDLHWIDPSSLELLEALVEQGATSRLMLLCTARPEFRAPWRTRSHHTQLVLAGLAAQPMQELVAGLVDRAGMADDLVTAVVQRADGVPLFAEELTRLMLDGEGNQAPDAMEIGHIPATLLDSLAARLDRLSTGKAVAQIGSVLGRQFSHDLVRAVSHLPEDELQAGLAQLADAELIYVRGAPPQATYQFKHALIQDAAYAALLKTRRRELHARAAQAIAGRFADLADARAEVLAHHWTQAGEADRAIAAWTRAAEAAANRHAFAEAEEDYRRAISVLSTTPDTAARDQHELDLGLALVRTTATTQGPQSAETAALTERNLVLAQRGGFLGANTGSRVLIYSQHLMAGEWRQAAEQADEMALFAARLAPDTETKWLRYAHAMAPFTRFNSDYFRGDLTSAEAQYRRWEAFHDGGDYDQRITSTLGLCNGAQLACWIGLPDLASTRAAKARAWAAATDSAYEVTVAGALEALLQVSLREVARAEALAAQAVKEADEKGFSQAAGWGRAALGWALAQQGAPAEGVELIRRAMDDLSAIQTRVSMPWFLTLLAEALAVAKQNDQAFDTFGRALTINPEERLYRPYALIGRGELLARIGENDLAERDFRAAINDAASMGAKGYELRAATGLARLLSIRGGKEDASAIISLRLDAAITDFDTIDIAAARSLAIDLSS